MENEQTIQKINQLVRTELEHAEGGHDWWHCYRVWKNAQEISKKEKQTIDMFVVESAALLHDIADAKFFGGDETIGPAKALEILESLGVETSKSSQVIHIIKHISFKNAEIEKPSIEFQIVQDADRLDALGAIGIARTFNYGGFKNRPIYNPEIAPQLNMTKEEYKNYEGPSINHFYEKLLLLKDKMNTKTGLKMAEERHNFIIGFLEQFKREAFF